MPTQLNFTLAPQGGEIDKYTVTLLDLALNPIETKTFTPPFGSSITGSFLGIAPNTSYKLDRKSYIGTRQNSCSLIDVSTTMQTINVTGNIDGSGDSVVISNLSQTIPCNISFPVSGNTMTGGGAGTFSVTVTIPSGTSGGTEGNVDGNNGVVTDITPSANGGTTINYIQECNGIEYIFTLAINGASAPFLFDYGATLADTTGAPLTEQEYIDSVDDVYLVSGEVHGIAANSGDDVVVNSFGNGTDQVLFIQVAASEAPFTKWSEVGNPFQQNQLIDGAFGLGSNVWFMSQRDGKYIYITRSQTSFAGAVVLSR